MPWPVTSILVIVVQHILEAVYAPEAMLAHVKSLAMAIGMWRWAAEEWPGQLKSSVILSLSSLWMGCSGENLEDYGAFFCRRGVRYPHLPCWARGPSSQLVSTHHSGNSFWELSALSIATGGAYATWCCSAAMDSLVSGMVSGPNMLV